MKYSIQFDIETGIIVGGINFDPSKGPNPVCQEGYNQLIIDKYVDLTNKVVDPDTMKLIDITNNDIFNPETGEFEPDSDQSELGFWNRIKAYLGM